MNGNNQQYVNFLQMQANNFKEQGVEQYKQGNLESALGFFTNSIECTPNNPSLYNNRSSTQFKLANIEAAYQDA
mgnify:CR=1 FL=1|jgi:hypothetical protein